MLPSQAFPRSLSTRATFTAIFTISIRRRRSALCFNLFFPTLSNNGQAQGSLPEMPQYPQVIGLIMAFATQRGRNQICSVHSAPWWSASTGKPWEKDVQEHYLPANDIESIPFFGRTIYLPPPHNGARILALPPFRATIISRRMTTLEKIACSAIQEQADRILRSTALASKPQVRRLLQTLAGSVDGKVAVNSARIIQELWPEEIQTKGPLDVAKEVSRLRGALEAYYASEGQADPTIIFLPNRSKPGPDGTPEKRWIAAVSRNNGAPTSPVSVLTASAQSVKLPETAAISRRNRWELVVWAGVVLVVLIAGVVYYRSHRIQRLSDKDTIVLADFTNTTGDPVFDGTLRQGLSAQLEQSPFLSLLSDTSVAQTLALMAQPKDARLTGERAREVCQRTASMATIEGSIASLGTQYVVTLKALSCLTGDSLGEEQVTANSREQVLNALSEAARKLRKRLGESLASVEKYDTPLEKVSTPSLEALRAYTLGYRALNVTGADAAAALRSLQEAISLDPNFAMAYVQLAVSYNGLGETVRANENLRKAYELRRLVSERERFLIDAQYDAQVTGDLEAAQKVYELWEQTYPRDPTPLQHLCSIYAFVGEFDKELAALQDYMRLGGGRGVFYAGAVITYLALYRVDEARAAAEEARVHNLDSPVIHINLYLADFLQHDAAGMVREAASLVGKSGDEDILLCYESDTAAYAGQFIKARELTRRAAESAKRVDEKEEAVSYEAEAALREALVGNRALARQQARRAVALSNGRDAEAMSAVALGLAGDSAEAMRLADDLKRRFPKGTIVQYEYLPMIRGASFLGGANASKKAGEAVQVLSAAAPYEQGDPSWTLNLMLYPAYLRGGAYLAMRQGEAAAAEFQKILDHPGVVLNEPIGALAHLGLARAYALAGDIVKSRSAYQDFLTLWKAADPDIPIYKQAKTEYAKLCGSS